MKHKNSIIKGIVLVIVAMLMQSCLVTKNYERPEIEIPERFRNFREADSVSMANIPWDNLFGDPILQKHINQALVKNYDLRLAMQEIYRAKAIMQQGKAGYWPTLDLSATVTSSDFSDNSALGQQFANLGGGNQGNVDLPNRIEQYDLTAALNWEVDIWGGITSNKKATVAAYLRTEAGQRVARTQLIANVTSIYNQLMTLDEQLDIAKQSVENRKRSLEIVQKLKEAGLEREVAVQQAGSQLKVAELLALEFEQSIRILENAFSVLIGENPREIERGRLKDEYNDISTQLGYPSYLLRNRPDVVQAEFNLINAFELTNFAKTEFYPKLNLGGSAGFQSLDAGDWISSASFFNVLTAGLTQPLLNRRQIRTNYEVAKIDQESAKLEFEQILLTAYQEVSDAIYTYELGRQQYNVRKEQIAYLQKAEEYSLRLYQNGFTTYLDVLVADTNKLQADIELVNLKFNGLNATIELYRALGGGWNKVIDPNKSLKSNMGKKDIDAGR